MKLDIKWVSTQGFQRNENRDFCGIAIKPNASLFIVVDGSTQGPKGDQLAKELAYFVVDNFLIDTSPSNEAIIAILKNAHSHFRRKFSADSASYIILLCLDNNIQVIHIGDCRLGFFKNQMIEWETHVDLVKAVPHSLTKSFRAREFFLPHVKKIEFYSGDCLLLSTDGFWNELPLDSQVQFLDGNIQDPFEDDISCLLIKKDFPFKIHQYKHLSNIYYRNMC